MYKVLDPILGTSMKTKQNKTHGWELGKAPFIDVQMNHKNCEAGEPVYPGTKATASS